MKIDYEILVLSDDWHGLPFSCKHLLSHFLPSVPLIWVETIGLRSPKFNLYDIKRSIQKLSGWLKPTGSYPEALPRNLHILSPMQIPYNDIGIVRNLNKRMMIRSVQHFGPKRPKRLRVLITTWPFVENLLGHLGEDLSIYYRVDDYSEFPGVHKANIKRQEYELIQKADIIVATAEDLAQIDIVQKPVHYLPHGVDFEHFCGNQHGSPNDLPIQQIPPPRIGFFGLLSEWVDFELLSQVATENPQWSFVFIGPSQISKSEFSWTSNVHFLGHVPYKDLPRHVRHFDVGLIPFKVNALTQRVNPLKLMEYLAMGVPVVSTPLPEVLKYKDQVAIATSARDFSGAIRASVEQDSPRARQARQETAKAHTWEKRSLQLKRWIDEELSKKFGFDGSPDTQLIHHHPQDHLYES